MEKYDFGGFGGFGGMSGESPFDFGGGAGERVKRAGNAEERVLSSPRGDVYYRVAKSPDENAPWLVLLHGAGMDHTVFDRTADSLSGELNIIAPDLPLHGLSEEYGDFSLAACACDVRDMLNNEGAERACIAGHCIGGCAAQAFAEKFPEYCSGLVLIDTLPFGQELYDYGDYKWLRRLAGLLRVLPKKAFAAVLSGAFTATVEGNRELMKIMSVQNTASVTDALTDTLGELYFTDAPDYGFPVLDIIGANDRIGRIRKLNETAADRCGFILSTIENAGHAPFLDNPEEFCLALAGFLREL